MSSTRRIIIPVFPDVDLLDVTGPAEVFAPANRETGGAAGYRVELAGRARGEVTTSAGLRLVADLSFDEVDGVLDTLLVPGAVEAGPGGPVARVDGDVVAWVARVTPLARRVVSVCVGAHLLAAAGVLDGMLALRRTAPGQCRRAIGRPPRIRSFGSLISSK